MDLSENYQFNYQKLLKFLRRTNHNGYMFAMADDYRFINQINSGLISDLQQQNVLAAIIFLRKDDQPLFQQIKEAADQTQSLIVANLYEVINNSAAGLNQLLHLNFSREELRQLKTPLLFWVDAASLNIISNHAPDLFSQRRFTTVHFTGKVENAVKEVFEKPEWKEFISTEKFKETEAKIETLKRRLKDAEETGYNSNRLATEIALPLAKEYAELGLKDKAEPILEKYIACLHQNNGSQLAQLARVYYLLHQYPLAIETMQKATKLVEDTLVEKKPPKVYPSEWFYNILDLTDWMKEYGLQDEALDLLKKAEKLLAETLDSFSYEWGRDFLGIFKERIGEIYTEKDELQLAIEFYQGSLNIRKELLNKNQHSEHLKRQISVAYKNLGAISEDLGKFQEARDYYQQSFNITEQLEKNNTQNEKFKRDLAVSLCNLGNISLKLGNLQEAKDYYEQSLEIVRQLAKTNPQNEQLKSDIAIYFWNLTLVAEQQKNKEEALNYIKSAYSIFKALSEVNPMSKEIKRYLENTENKIAALESQSQQV